MSGPEFDYVIVGAGSAGCVLANRLSADGRHRVLLLEAGPADRYVWIHVPIGYGKTMFHPVYNWGFSTESEHGMNGRRIYWPRGRVLGGSSSINGLIFIRGQREDYEHWAALGNRGWGWADVLPYFIRSEANQRGASEYHGADGPQAASDIGAKHELVEAFIRGAVERGVPRNADFNGAVQEGVGYYQLATRNGLRSSSATAYLRPARRRENLAIETGAHASRIVFEGGRAAGIEYRQGGRSVTARANREVILAAGALQSPQLLQLSGVGPAGLLAEHGIPAVRELPGVGENLQDHLQLRVIFRCTRPITTNDELNSLTGRIRIGLQWLLARSGPLAIGINQGGLFTRVLPESKTPDVQFHFATLSAELAGAKPHPWSGFTISEAMRPYVASEFRPGEAAQSDEELLGFAREYGATIFHPSGTCRMGSDPMAVVDARLRVHGVAGLRVVDCSIMPVLVSGNTHWPAVMIAEKASDMILEDVPPGPL